MLCAEGLFGTISISRVEVDRILIPLGLLPSWVGPIQRWRGQWILLLLMTVSISVVCLFAC